MNAKTNEFQLNSEDFKELVAKRRDQLRRGMMLNDLRYDQYTNYNASYRHSLSTRLESPRSSMYSINLRSENEKRSNDPLVDDYDSEKSSYARKKLLKNIERNTERRTQNYFYDDAVLRFDDEYAFDGSILFAKRRKSIECNWENFTCELPTNSSFHYGADQVSNDGSYGYYLPPEDEEEEYFVNDTLTLAPPAHRASI